MYPLIIALVAMLLTLPRIAGAAPDRRYIEQNGPELNGTDLGAPRALAAVSLKRVQRADGSTLPGVTLKGGALSGGGPLVGALLDATATSTSPGPLTTVRLRIDGVIASPVPGVQLYAVSYQEGSAGWRPICIGGERAIALPGTWDYHRGVAGDSGKLAADTGSFTFACERGALAKCVLKLGYLPWLGPDHDALHQACVRAIRADYCGNGESQTVEGTQVNFYDTLGVRKDDQPWTLEAVWSPQGASCVSSPRLQKEPRAGGGEVKHYVFRVCKERLRAIPCVPAAQGPSLTTEHQPRTP